MTQNGNLFIGPAIREIECTAEFKIIPKPNVKERITPNYDYNESNLIFSQFRI